MAEIKQTSEDSHLHWFWKLTTKWWFFPMFYVILSIFVFIISLIAMDLKPSSFDIDEAIFGSTLMSISFAIFLPGLEGFRIIFGFMVMILFYIFSIVSIILILYFKYKKNRLLRNLIKAVFLLFTLAFLSSILNIYLNINNLDLYALP